MTMTRRLKEAEARHGEAQAQLQAATGDAEEVARFERARVAKEKEERVELLYRQASRRRKCEGLLRGWTSWQAKSADDARLRRTVVRGAHRLAAPLAAARFKAWWVDWDWEQRRVQLQRHRETLETRAAARASERDVEAERRMADLLENQSLELARASRPHAPLA